MRFLLDTHTFLWWITNDQRLSARAHEVIGTGKNKLFFSAASGWEIAIKAKLGRLQLPDDWKRFISDQLADNAIESLAIQMRHALHVHTLPTFHQDPFDRMLVAQSQLEVMPIITADAQINRYPVQVVW
ncbi:MAG: type II toxin-antitoxin system VapC family toxin [Desulfotomaculum sp.]|nr:type II toxin-antitoxin system VapC family toxin [Desulfotomaculum sp.]MCL0081229.1 type II toxin-antitoxin system VapC family toxin [Peptococcaceae bacterium]